MSDQHNVNSALSAPEPSGKDSYCTSGNSPTNAIDGLSGIESREPQCPLPTNSVTTNTSYEFIGRPDLPVVLVLGGISAGRHVRATTENPTPGWWDKVVGPQADGIDTNLFSVLGVDWIGGPESTIDLRSGPVTTEDRATAISKRLDELNIDKVAAWYGELPEPAF